MTTPAREITGLVPEVFTIDEAAVILRVKKSWLERRAAARRIPFTMLGGSYHFLPDHLHRIVAEYEETPNVPAQPTSQVIPAVRRKRRSPVEVTDPRVVPLQPRPRTSRRLSQSAA
ncbi:helix-turn-helix domain-containing protein [Actinoplanes subtropicus]|uniref:helix-turn-helix domain-containing protein n=1 Tax=Actinoplanes subtropicus TaxID=543632 RepID=UPI0012F84E80|nr:helix-turn-helix domain-containing protein [Actinoplanes subtropicus]